VTVRKGDLPGVKTWGRGSFGERRRIAVGCREERNLQPKRPRVQEARPHVHTGLSSCVESRHKNQNARGKGKRISKPALSSSRRKTTPYFSRKKSSECESATAGDRETVAGQEGECACGRSTGERLAKIVLGGERDRVSRGVGGSKARRCREWRKGQKKMRAGEKTRLQKPVLRRIEGRLKPRADEGRARGKRNSSAEIAERVERRAYST